MWKAQKVVILKVAFHSNYVTTVIGWIMKALFRIFLGNIIVKNA